MVTETTVAKKVRPFHETIVEAIRRCNPSPSSGEIYRLLLLIKKTKIPAGHDEIIAAVKEYFNFSGGEKWATVVREVEKSVLEQKQAIASEAGEAEGISLEDLEKETEQLLALLKDRQTGLMSWHEAMHDRLKSLYQIISRALGRY